jgi:hypothetical protein
VSHVQRLKKGLSITQPLRTNEVRGINPYTKTWRGVHHDGFFFCSERGKVLSRVTLYLRPSACKNWIESQENRAMTNAKRRSGEAARRGRGFSTRHLSTS